MVKNCYVHIPFCKRICSYCDFCKLFYNTGYVSSYLEALNNEIKRNYNGEKLETLYIGGGTPSSLSIVELEELFSILSIFKKTSSCELTIEANFDSITEEKIDLFKKYGVNRISFGIETTHDWISQKMNRTLDKKYVRQIISYCKKIGITNINVDLMYAFPGETLDEVEDDIDFILSLDVPHVSTYSLILEEHTKLFLENMKNISEELDAKMYELICSKLSNFSHYEISNFAKDNLYSKHNLCYWNNDNYYGFGLGASGYLDNIRYTNTKSITYYLQEKYCYGKEEIGYYDMMEYQIILNLRTKWGISKQKFFTKYHKQLNEVFPYSMLVYDGYLVDNDDFVFIPEKYWYLSNEIMVKLLEECNYE